MIFPVHINCIVTVGTWLLALAMSQNSDRFRSVWATITPCNGEVDMSAYEELPVPSGVTSITQCVLYCQLMENCVLVVYTEYGDDTQCYPFKAAMPETMAPSTSFMGSSDQTTSAVAKTTRKSSWQQLINAVVSVAAGYGFTYQGGQSGVVTTAGTTRTSQGTTSYTTPAQTSTTETVPNCRVVTL